MSDQCTIFSNKMSMSEFKTLKFHKLSSVKQTFQFIYAHLLPNSPCQTLGRQIITVGSAHIIAHNDVSIICHMHQQMMFTAATSNFITGHLSSQSAVFTHPSTQISKTHRKISTYCQHFNEWH